jgi:hypothetical protein
LGDVITTTNTLAQLLDSNMSTISNTLTSITLIVQRYEMNGDSIIDESDDYIDLYDFAWLVKGLIDNSDIKVTAQSLMDSITDYIVLNRNSNMYYPTWNLQNSHGLSIFFPYTASSFYNGNNYEFALGAIWPNQSYGLNLDTQETIMWAPMLIDYFQLTQPGGPNNPNPPEPLPKLIEIQKIFLPISMK